MIALLECIADRGGHDDMDIFERTRQDLADAADGFLSHLAASPCAISAS